MEMTFAMAAPGMAMPAINGQAHMGQALGAQPPTRPLSALEEFVLSLMHSLHGPKWDEVAKVMERRSEEELSSSFQAMLVRRTAGQPIEPGILSSYIGNLQRGSAPQEALELGLHEWESQVRSKVKVTQVLGALPSKEPKIVQVAALHALGRKAFHELPPYKPLPLPQPSQPPLPQLPLPLQFPAVFPAAQPLAKNGAVANKPAPASLLRAATQAKKIRKRPNGIAVVWVDQPLDLDRLRAEAGVEAAAATAEVTALLSAAAAAPPAASQPLDAAAAAGGWQPQALGVAGLQTVLQSLMAARQLLATAQQPEVQAVAAADPAAPGLTPEHPQPQQQQQVAPALQPAPAAAPVQLPAHLLEQLAAALQPVADAAARAAGAPPPATAVPALGAHAGMMVPQVAISVGPSAQQLPPTIPTLQQLSPITPTPQQFVPTNPAQLLPPPGRSSNAPTTSLASNGIPAGTVPTPAATSLSHTTHTLSHTTHTLSHVTADITSHHPAIPIPRCPDREPGTPAQHQPLPASARSTTPNPTQPLDLRTFKRQRADSGSDGPRSSSLGHDGNSGACSGHSQQRRAVDGGKGAGRTTSHTGGHTPGQTPGHTAGHMPGHMPGHTTGHTAGHAAGHTSGHTTGHTAPRASSPVSSPPSAATGSDDVLQQHGIMGGACPVPRVPSSSAIDADEVQHGMAALKRAVANVRRQVEARFATNRGQQSPASMTGLAMHDGQQQPASAEPFGSQHQQAAPVDLFEQQQQQQLGDTRGVTACPAGHHSPAAPRRLVPMVSPFQAASGAPPPDPPFQAASGAPAPGLPFDPQQQHAMVPCHWVPQVVPNPGAAMLYQGPPVQHPGAGMSYQGPPGTLVPCHGPLVLHPGGGELGGVSHSSEQHPLQGLAGCGPGHDQPQQGQHILGQLHGPAPGQPQQGHMQGQLHGPALGQPQQGHILGQLHGPALGQPQQPHMQGQLHGTPQDQLQPGHMHGQLQGPAQGDLHAPALGQLQGLTWAEQEASRQRQLQGPAQGDLHAPAVEQLQGLTWAEREASRQRQLQGIIQQLQVSIQARLGSAGQDHVHGPMPGQAQPAAMQGQVHGPVLGQTQPEAMQGQVHGPVLGQTQPAPMQGHMQPAAMQSQGQVATPGLMQTAMLGQLQHAPMQGQPHGTMQGQPQGAMQEAGQGAMQGTATGGAACGAPGAATGFGLLQALADASRAKAIYQQQEQQRQQEQQLQRQEQQLQLQQQDEQQWQQEQQRQRQQQDEQKRQDQQRQQEEQQRQQDLQWQQEQHQHQLHQQQQHHLQQLQRQWEQQQLQQQQEQQLQEMQEQWLQQAQVQHQQQQQLSPQQHQQQQQLQQQQQQQRQQQQQEEDEDVLYVVDTQPYLGPGMVYMVEAQTYGVLPGQMLPEPMSMHALPTGLGPESHTTVGMPQQQHTYMQAQPIGPDGQPMRMAAGDHGFSMGTDAQPMRMAHGDHGFSTGPEVQPMCMANGSGISMGGYALPAALAWDPNVGHGLSMGDNHCEQPMRMAAEGPSMGLVAQAGWAVGAPHMPGQGWVMLEDGSVALDSL